MVHGSLLGLTDDEAYYWVLAQRPALGYAFHPPAVAWVIALAQLIFGELFGGAVPGLVRLPAAAFSAGVLVLALRWAEAAGVPGQRIGRVALAVLSFAGLFAASWMMVPDLPMLFGWMLAFVSVWRLCFDSAKKPVLYLNLGFAVALALLSKYSAVLMVASAVVSLGLWSPRAVFFRGLAVIGLGCVLAVVPILIWNASHDWASLLYQLRERHGDLSFSMLRYARFWAIQAVLAGPVLLIYGFALIYIGFRSVWFRSQSRQARVVQFILVWLLPGALVFCTQPAWAEFKPHWAFIVWLPVALALGWHWAMAPGFDGLRQGPVWVRSQVMYGLSLGVIALVLCHWPITSWIARALTGREPDPRWDVSNDMYGWSQLKTLELFQERSLPVIGSRYQTASQIAFSLGAPGRVTLLPRDQKQLDEWPDLQVSSHQEPGWPRLLRPVLFIADNRYDAGPGFIGAECKKLDRIEFRRSQYQAKWFDLWRCDPSAK